MIEYFIRDQYGSDFLIIGLSLFVACQHLNSGTNLRECEEQSRLKFQVVTVFRFY
jgi:hypothetical protein